MKQFRDSLIVALLLLAFIHALVAMCFPTPYGRWLQRIDNGRYEFMNGSGE